jgi:hypothetical protein
VHQTLRVTPARTDHTVDNDDFALFSFSGCRDVKRLLGGVTGRQFLRRPLAYTYCTNNRLLLVKQLPLFRFQR